MLFSLLIRVLTLTVVFSAAMPTSSDETPCWSYGGDDHRCTQPWRPSKRFGMFHRSPVAMTSSSFKSRTCKNANCVPPARSPCPALNALANEGLLPRSGRNITIAQTVAAFSTGLNFAADVITSFAATAIAQCSNITNTTCTSFDLDMLNVPHAAEHDGSLSREDFNFGRGNNHDFSPRVWAQVMDYWGDAEIIDFALAEGARRMRFRTANETDLPGWFVPKTMQSLGETSFYMAAFGDPVLGNARKDWVHYWFSQERLPFALGWKPTQRAEITGASMAAMIAKMIAA